MKAFTILFTCALGLLLAPSASAQPRLLGEQPVGFGNNGFHIYSATLSAGYFSSALIGGNTVPGAGGDYQGWASITSGYSFSGTKGVFSMDYTPEYTDRVRYSNLRSFNQNLSLNWSRRLGTKWAWHLSAAGAEASASTYLFTDGGISSVVSSPGTTDVLTGGLSSGSTVALTPSQLIVFGGRVITGGGSTGLTYHPTTRLQFTFDANASDSQTRYDSTGIAPLVPRTFTGTGAVSMGYSLSPRTVIGTRISYTNTQSSVTKFDFGVVDGFIDQKFGTHWFASASAGPALIRLAILGGRSQVLSYNANAQFGYRVRSSSFAASFRRMVGDSYGFGAGANQTYDGAWDQRLRSSGWVLRATGGRQEFTGGGFGGLKTNYAGGGISKAINRQLSVGLEYSFLHYAGSVYRQSDFQVGRLNLTWIPFLRDTPLLTNDPKQAQP